MEPINIKLPKIILKATKGKIEVSLKSKRLIVIILIAVVV
jgi:hypothetical protein